MPALTEVKKHHVVLGVVILAAFVAGMMSSSLAPKLRALFHKGDTEQALVEKISDDSLKLSDETLKNIRITPVKEGNVPEMLSVMGKISVAEDRTTVIASRVSGRIDNVHVASGAEIKAGQALATLFSPDYVIAREEYLQTLNELKASKSAEDKKMLNLSVQKLESIGVSRHDIDHLNENDKNPVLVVRSPRDGAVIDKKAVVGNLVNPGDPLFTVGDINSIWFAGDIYPDDLEKVHKGQEVIIEPEGGVKSIHGTVSFISPLVDATTRTIKIRAQMDNPGSALRIDMYVRGNIILSEKLALTIPKGSLVREGDGFICFKELPDHVFKKVNVETSGESNDWVIISKGLQAGDEVVSEGALLLVSALNTSGGSPTE